MKILLVSLKELLPHYLIWGLAIGLLWDARRRIKAIDLDWVATWEKKHQARIDTLLHSWGRLLALSRIAAWMLLSVTLVLLVTEWEMLSLIATDQIVQYPEYFRKLAVTTVKVLLTLMFGSLVLASTTLHMKTKLARLREVIRQQPDTSR